MESIRILQDTYEKLYAITPPLADFLEIELKKLSNYWKDDYVTPMLQKKGVFKEWNHLYEIDSYYLLEILRNYWKEFSKKTDSNFFSKNNYELFVNRNNRNSLIAIRNEVSHPEYWDYEEDIYHNWNESFLQAAEQLGTALSELLYELHKPEKERILNIIFTKVINPALNSSVLPNDILQSIRDTKNRLEAQNTAAGIIAFFTDALHSVRGKKIYEEFCKNNMQSFESIKDEVLYAYYRGSR